MTLAFPERPGDTAGDAPMPSPIVECVFANVAHFCAQRRAFGDEKAGTTRDLPRDTEITK